ncbi:MAG: hypothetical protein IPL36_11475 [Nigerium sp.]|nr:hypothetical protein [Nigerium sp.]
MTGLPPVPPRVEWTDRVRLSRDYYVRVAGNDYSVDPTVIGRFVDVRCGLTLVTVACAGVPVAAHARCWDQRQTISDPAHVATAHTPGPCTGPGGRQDRPRSVNRSVCGR